MIRAVAIALLFTAAAHADWQLPKGYRIDEYAREPRIVDPVAMDWDADGHVYVLESSGQIKRLTTDDKIVADGLEGATGLAVHDGRIYVARAPELLVIHGTNRQVLVSNLPQPDLRGKINSLRFGPDGWLYGRHGIQATSVVGRPGTPPEERTKMNVGIWRYHPRRKVFEVLCHGGGP